MKDFLYIFYKIFNILLPFHDFSLYFQHFPASTPQGRLQCVGIHSIATSFLATQLRQKLRCPGIAAVAAKHLAQGADGRRWRWRRCRPRPCLAKSQVRSSQVGKKTHQSHANNM
jgi:hypothetical protein